MSLSQIIHRIGGAKTGAGCDDIDPFRCWVCGTLAQRGVLRTKWMGSNYTAQNRARAPLSEHVCEACVIVMAGRPPDTERMWSHLVDGDEHVRVNKGSKPTIRAFLRREHAAHWAAAIADSGQKHIIPWCPINAPRQNGGRVSFEETLVELPRDSEGWDLLDEIANALTDGATKEEIRRGEYTPRAWQLLGATRLRTLEAWWSRHRSGAWFDLALWLAQRDEEKVAARLDAEKTAKTEAKSEAGRRGKGKAADAPRGGRPRSAKRVSADTGVQRAEALDDAAGPDAGGGANEGDTGGVAHRDDADAAAVSTAREQLGLFS